MRSAAPDQAEAGWGGVWPFAAIIAGAAILAYSRTFTVPFLFDDLGAIAGNSTLRHWSTAFFPPAGGMPVSGRPLVNLSLAANYAWSGTQTWSYHLSNLLIHVFAGWTLFGVARRTLGFLPQLAPRGDFLALAISLLWTLHPIQTESVTYLSQRAEALMGLFYLLSLYGFIRAYGREPSADRWAVVSVGAAALGMLAKEVMVTAPVMIFLYDRTFCAGGFKAAWRKRRGYYAALACSWIALAYVVIQAGSRGNTAGFHSSVKWWAYSFTQLRSVADYFRLSLWPRPLIFDYGLVLGGPRVEMIGDAILVIGLLVGTSWLLGKRSPWGFLGAWFFVILAPSSSVIPVATELEAEHRVYLSLAAVIAGVVIGANWLLTRLTASNRLGATAIGRIGLGLLTVAAIALAASTFARNHAYESVLAFWQDAAEKTPDNAGARNNFGNALAEQGRIPEAIVQYEAALRLVPDYDDPHYNLGNALTKQQHWAEAVKHYQAALRFRADSADLRYALGHALAQLGQARDAQQQYELAMKAHTENPEVWYNLGNGLLDYGDGANAAIAFGKAIALRPDYPDALLNYSGALAQLGQIPAAVQAMQALLKLQPDAADVHNNLGGLLAESGRLADAKVQFQAALRIKPDYREARDNLRRVEYLEQSGAR